MDRWLAAPLLAMLVVLTPLGCVSVDRGDTLVVPARGGFDEDAARRAAVALDDAWPDRYGDRRGTKGVIREIELPVKKWEMGRLGDERYLRYKRDERDDLHAWRRGLGLRWRVGAVFEGPGGFIVRFEEGEPEKRELRKPGRDPDLLFTHVSGRRYRRGGAVWMQRTWFAYYDPAPNTEAQGSMLLLPGIFGTPEPIVARFVEAMRGRGWAVVRMLAHPSRFTEQVEFQIDPGSPERAADAIADVLTDRAAECAFAAESAMGFVESRRPGLEDMPRVALGMSGGAMVLPTVVAREPERYAASVLIAGGSNFFATTYRSNYQDFVNSISFRFEGEVKDERAALDAIVPYYLERAPLDSHHTALALQGMPVLMLHGAGDRAVPSELGDQLWEQLGRPERWVLPVGHELLFLFLPGQFQPILDWVDVALEARADAPAAEGRR